MGPDSYGRLATEKFMRQAGISMTHIPYKGMGAIVQALMTGEVKLMISSTTPQTSQLVKDGKLNMLGVAALEPTPLLPGVEPIARTLKGVRSGGVVRDVCSSRDPCPPQESDQPATDSNEYS